MEALHDTLAWVSIVANGVVACWALAAAARPALRSPWLWRCTAAAQLTLFAKVGTDAWLVAVDGREIDGTHQFYGFLTLIAVAILYSYRQQLAEHIHLLYGFGGLFVTGLAIRAATLPL